MRTLDDRQHPRMEAFAPYVRSLEDLVHRTAGLAAPAPDDGTLIDAALNGQPGARLRALVGREARRRAGAFFTGQPLAARALRPYAPTLSAAACVYDPACGAGDLLLACARCLPMDADLSRTLDRWGQQLRGCDLHAELVRAAKARLVLLALARGAAVRHPLPPWDEVFPHLKTADGLLDPLSETATHLLLNPPYGRTTAPAGCTWAAGSVSRAAVFFERCLRSAPAGTRMVAILPDVLRSGSRYAHWRQMVEDRGIIEASEVIGAFDSWADVDVFVLRMVVSDRRSRRATAWCEPAEKAPAKRVADYFSVHVGPVVPHRHPESGKPRPYLHSRLLPPWGTLSLDEAPRRQFDGRTFHAPFVAVRRTSAPGDRARAIATLVVGRGKPAVENHLLLLLPHDGTVERCRQLLSLLQDERTRRWLDQRIRCRHLTVAAMRDLPWRFR